MKGGKEKERRSVREEQELRDSGSSISRAWRRPAGDTVEAVGGGGHAILSLLTIDRPAPSCCR